VAEASAAPPPAAGDPGSPAGRRSRAPVVAGLALIAVVLLVLALFLGWFVVQQTGPGPCPGIAEWLGPSGVASSPSAGSGCATGESGGFSAAGLPATGRVYEAVTVLVGVAVALALVAVLLLPRPGPRPSHRAVAPLLAVAAVVALAAPAALVIWQPAAICQDEPSQSSPIGVPAVPSGPERPAQVPNASAPTPTPACDDWVFWTSEGGEPAGTGNGNVGPQYSFWGGSSGYGEHLTWGPSVGLFLDLGASLLLVGAAGVALASPGPAPPPPVRRFGP
jgi:hypothetical protein